MTTLCLLALATPVPPQLEPYELVNRTVGHRLKHVRAADFDHDGRLDLLSASETDGRVLYHRNLGSPGFETATEIARKDKVGVPDLEALDAVDLDVDGNVDAVYVFAEMLHWRQGHGDSTFAPEEVLGPMLGAGGLEFVDFDGDGWLDVFGFSRGVRTLWGTGPGEFIPGHMSGVPSALTPVRRVAFADFDGDGAMDLAFQAADEWTGGFLPTLVDGLVGVRYQVAPRALGAVDVLFPLGGTEGTDLFAVDIDDDGRIDVLQQSGSRIHLFRNSAVGFESRAILADRYRTRELLVADVDLDGDDELVTVEGDHPYGFGPQEIVTHAQDPAGTFSVAHVFTSVGEAATSPSFVDLDGDGRLDLLHASSHDDLLLFHQAEASGGYAPPVEITDRFRLSPSDPNVGVVDLDADGLVDVVALGHEDVRFALQEPDGSFGRTLPTGWRAPERGFPELADVDGDGDIDLVSVPEPEDGGEYELQWLPWSGSGFGAPRTIATSPVDLNTPRCFDWDGDGDLDVLVASATLGEVSVHVNVGGGVFQPLPRTLDVPGATTRPSMDVDGDGLRELVVESSDVDGMRTFIHAVPGTGRFGPAVEIGAAVAAVRALSFFDLDGDGDREAVRVESTSSISNAGDSRLYENLGGAGFAAGADLPLGAGARARYRGM
ncbi:MAG: VCBS repeat-containing protein, partial [Planctomycetota bacterium]